MNCKNHPQLEALGTCVGCGTFFCGSCLLEVGRKHYCKDCSADLLRKQEQEASPRQQIVITQQASQQVSPPSGPTRSTKSRMTAAFLALFLGGLGIHHFYLGNGGTGFLYFIFSWTLIPAILGLIDAISLFTMSEEKFHLKYRYR